jgi:crossover junction endodeoxyribonuclease RuvC
VDPGSRHTGYGLVGSAGGRLEMLAQGRFSPPAAWPLPRRLAHIHQGLSELLSGHRPAAVAVEDIFHGPNIRSALKLGHVRGVVLLAAAQAGAEVYEYAPRLVKSSVAGYGQAEKSQVARMVAELLNFRGDLAEDAADALAVALCHAGQSRLGGLGSAPRNSRRGGWRGLTEADLAALVNSK